MEPVKGWKYHDSDGVIFSRFSGDYQALKRGWKGVKWTWNKWAGVWPVYAAKAT
jgi:hypothetical protein